MSDTLLYASALTHLEVILFIDWHLRMKHVLHHHKIDLCALALQGRPKVNTCTMEANDDRSRTHLSHGMHAVEPSQEGVRIVADVLKAKNEELSKMQPLRSHRDQTYLIVTRKYSPEKEKFIGRQSLYEKTTIIGFEEE